MNWYRHPNTSLIRTSSSATMSLGEPYETKTTLPLQLTDDSINSILACSVDYY